jgi:lysophospholipase L1-like esterase
MDVAQTHRSGPVRRRRIGSVAMVTAVLASAAGIAALNVMPASAATCATSAASTTNAVTAVDAAGEAVMAPAAVTAAAKIKVWMAGDSTMSNASTCPIGWGSQFAPFFNSDVTVVNSAMAGRSIQTWLYDPNVTSTMNSAGECVINPKTYSSRWQAMLNSSTGMKAGDYLFIQFGINDSSKTCNRHVGSARYKELLGVMAKAATDRGAHPIFLTPVAMISCSGSSAIGNRGFLTETKAEGTATKTPVVDLNKLSVTLYNKLKLCPNNGDYTKGAVGAFFCNDHTHFEAAGAKQIAAVVAQALKDQKIPVASYLK